MNVRDVVSTTLQKARAETRLSGKLGGKLHRERSRIFVEFLRCELVDKCGGEPDVMGFSRHKGAATLAFGMNEFLFDVAVLKYDKVNSGRSNKDLFYVSEAIWLVESELAADKRKALCDFNKLVVARSENLLFIGPILKSEREHSDYLRVLASAAENCIGNIYLALIPRPSDWGTEPEGAVIAYKWAAVERAWSEQ